MDAGRLGVASGRTNLNRAGYPFDPFSWLVSDTTQRSVQGRTSLESSGYRISVDGGRDSFFALCIEDPADEDRWLMSDTVRSLGAMR